MAPSRRAPRRFMGWKDLVVTPLVEVAIFGGAWLATNALDRGSDLRVLEKIAAVYGLQMVFSVVVVRVVTAIFPFRQGIHGPRTRQRYLFNLVGFLYMFNLHALLYWAMPPFFRQWVYRLLGTRVGGGVAIIGGVLSDPTVVSLGDDVVIGIDTIVLGHALSAASPHEDYVLIGRVEIGHGVVVGARSVVMPGVTIGDHAVVQAMSVVAQGTRVPPYEIWGGCPARK